MEYKVYHWLQQLWNKTFQLFKINWSPTAAKWLANYFYVIKQGFCQHVETRIPQ